MFNKKRINNIARKFGVEVHGKGYLQSLEKGEFKQDCFQVQQHIIKKRNPVIFDVGANRGNVVEQYLKYFPAASIYAFEPFPESFHFLNNRFLENNSIHCFEKAVASSAGSKEFFANKNIDTNSLLKPQKTGLTSDEQVKNLTKIEVEGVVLDEFCTKDNIIHIDILKMDIQGGEYDALKGLQNMLSKSAIDLIYTETYFVEQYVAQPLFHDISKMLFNYGYILQDIYNPIYGNGHIAWADVIFIKDQN